MSSLVATLGSKGMAVGCLPEALQLGVRRFRLNLDKCSDMELESAVRSWRREETFGELIFDIPGHKARTAPTTSRRLPQVRTGQELLLLEAGETHPDDPATPAARLELVGLAQWQLMEGDLLELLYGGVRCRILGPTAAGYRARIEAGGKLRDGEGLLVKNRYLEQTRLSPRAQAAIARGAAHGAELLALSFSDRGALLEQARAELEHHGCRGRLLAKIESPVAIAHLDEVLAASDGLILARGDLSFYYDDAEIDRLAIDLARRARAAGKRCDAASRLFRSALGDHPLDAGDRRRIDLYRTSGFDGLWSDETSYSRYWRAVVREAAKARLLSVDKST